MISIPEYFSKYIDSTIDLKSTPKICCPFHYEETPSFSYSADKGVWRCFGSCKCGGDVYELHRKFKHLRSREEAIIDLSDRLGLQRETLFDVPKQEKVYYENDRQFSILLNSALSIAVTPKDWADLDYIVSKQPVDIEELKQYVSSLKQKTNT